MQKPVRYLLLFLALAASACLVATAAGIYVANPPPRYQAWGKYFNFGSTHEVRIAVYSNTHLELDSHQISLPISWLGCCLLALALPTVACLTAASFLVRSLFTSPATKMLSSTATSVSLSKAATDPGSP